MAGALSGLKVVDLSRVLAGHGRAGRQGRVTFGHLGLPFDENGVAACFGAVNRDKRAITLDLTQPAARATLAATG